MTNQFQFSIPTVSGEAIALSLGVGDVLYLLGANGTGKSSLVSRLFGQQKNAKRISAHRQTWFESNTLDMTPRNREDMGKNCALTIRSRKPDIASGILLRVQACRYMI